MHETELLQKVFVSSTSEGMGAYRNAAETAIRSAGRFPVVMEDFAATTAPPLEVCLRKVRECDAYVLIVGFKYGSVATDGLSVTEHEYNAAQELRLPTMVFIQSDEAPIPAAMVDVGESRQKLDAFKERLKKHHTVSFFETPEELKGKIQHAVVNQESQVAGDSSDSHSQGAKPRLVLRGDEALRRYELFVLDPLRYSGSDMVLDLKVVAPINNCLDTPWLTKAMGLVAGDSVKLRVVPNDMPTDGILGQRTCELFVGGDHLEWLLSHLTNVDDVIRVRVRLIAVSLKELERDPNRSSIAFGMIFLHGFDR